MVRVGCNLCCQAPVFSYSQSHSSTATFHSQAKANTCHGPMRQNTVYLNPQHRDFFLLYLCTLVDFMIVSFFVPDDQLKGCRTPDLFSDSPLCRKHLSMTPNSAVPTPCLASLPHPRKHLTVTGSASCPQHVCSHPRPPHPVSPHSIPTLLQPPEHTHKNQHNLHPQTLPMPQQPQSCGRCLP